MYRLFSITVVSLLLFGGLCEQATAGGNPWIGVNGRFGTYAMGDVNDDINSWDAIVYARFEEITRGWGGGVDAGIQVNPGLSVSLHFERILASSKVSDYSGSMEYVLDANATYGSLEFRTPSNSKTVFGIGAGAGLVKSTGEINFSLVGYGAISSSLEGTGPLVQGYVFLEIPMSPRITLVPKAGYRYAKISSLEIEGQPIYNADGSDYSADYSGIYISVGIRLYLSD